MNPSVHQYLDGCRDVRLTPAEREEVLALEALIEEAAYRLRSEPSPDLVERVLAALPEPAAAPATRNSWGRSLCRVLGWLWNPQPIRISLRPAYGMMGAAFALVLIVGFLARGPLTPAGQPPVAAPDPVGALFVQFRLEARGASDVALAGSFTGWEPSYRLQQTAPGVWSVLVPLPPGVHDYTFVIDGHRWVPDPHAPAVPDNFGGANSRLTLLPPHNEV
jgi:hypothetical protein